MPTKSTVVREFLVRSAMLAGACISIPNVHELAAQTSATSAPKRWTISAAPIFATRSSESADATTLYDVYGATRLANGTIVVGDNGAQNVKWFGANGNMLRSFGRKGSGPGEFQLVEVIGTCGSDSLFVLDGASQRLTVLSLDGKLHGTRAIRTDNNEVSVPAEIRCNKAREFGMIGEPNGRFPEGRAPFRSMASVRLQSLDGKTIVNAGTVRSREMYRYGVNAGPRPLGKKSTIAMSATRLFVGTGDSATIYVYALDGKRAGDVKLPWAARKITRADIDAYVEGLVERNPSRSPAQIRELYSNLEYPATFPMHGELLVDSENHLWVEQYRLPGQTASRWLIFDLQNAPVAELQLPNRFRLLEAGRDYVLGTWSDEDDLNHVHMYRLIRS